MIRIPSFWVSFTALKIGLPSRHGVPFAKRVVSHGERHPLPFLLFSSVRRHRSCQYASARAYSSTSLRKLGKRTLLMFASIDSPRSYSSGTQATPAWTSRSSRTSLVDFQFFQVFDTGAAIPPASAQTTKKECASTKNVFRSRCSARVSWFHRSLRSERSSLSFGAVCRAQAADFSVPHPWA